MPVVKQGNLYVVKTKTGRVIGTHKTRKAAEEQLGKTTTKKTTPKKKSSGGSILGD